MSRTNYRKENILKKGIEKIIDVLSSLFLPFVNLMVSAGILKGILTLLIVMGVVIEGTTTYEILNAMSDAFFYFISVFLAYTAAKKFEVEPFTAILMACILLHPSMMSVMSGETADLFGITVQQVTYSSAVLPILLAVYFMRYAQRFCYKIIPETFKELFTPPICILITAPLTLLFFGPIGGFV